MTKRVIKRAIPPDHSCLYNSIGYLIDGSKKYGTDQRLREHCAKIVVEKAEDFPPVMIGMENEAYAKWVLQPTSWGGEVEIIILSKLFNVEIAVASMESSSILVYGKDLNVDKRIYILYTGQHYDVLVGRNDENEDTSNINEDTLVFTSSHDYKKIDELVLDCVKKEIEERNKRSQERRRKVLKCRGCGDIIDNTEQFQIHCSEKEHSEDFCYDCEEIEIVESINDVIVGNKFDINSSDILTVYNTNTSKLSNKYPSKITINGINFPSVEHFILVQEYSRNSEELRERIIKTESIDEAQNICLQFGSIFENWENERKEIILNAMFEKFNQNKEMRDVLVSTNPKKIVLIDNYDVWSGVYVENGVINGKNMIGELLMEIRQKLL